MKTIKCLLPLFFFAFILSIRTQAQEPKNWPEYETPMAALTHVTRKDGLELARYINSKKTTISKYSIFHKLPIFY